ECRRRRTARDGGRRDRGGGIRGARDRAAAPARPLDYTKTAGPDFSGPAGTGLRRRQLVFVGRLELVFGRYELAPEALEPVLAPNARRDFRQRLEPRGRDSFFAFD